MKRCGVVAVALGLTLAPVFFGADGRAELTVPLRTGDTMVFLGDSITAAGIRGRLVAHALKVQDVYPELVVSGMPGEMAETLMRAMGGEALLTPELRARWENSGFYAGRS